MTVRLTRTVSSVKALLSFGLFFAGSILTPTCSRSQFTKVGVWANSALTIWLVVAFKAAAAPSGDLAEDADHR
jgi:hypothetical protein